MTFFLGDCQFPGSQRWPTSHWHSQHTNRMPYNSSFWFLCGQPSTLPQQRSFPDRHLQSSNDLVGHHELFVLVILQLFPEASGAFPSSFYGGSDARRRNVFIVVASSAKGSKNKNKWSTNLSESYQPETTIRFVTCWKLPSNQPINLSTIQPT